MDLMFALPGQTLDDLKDDLTRALAHGTEHLSLYALTFEDDTPLTRQLLNGEVEPCPEQLEREMFELVGDTCARAGLQRYEVSNFARPCSECRHNLVYWTLGDWHGVGAGAHAMLGGEITANAADFKYYTAALLDGGKLPVARREQLNPTARAETLLLMGLRLREGLDLARYEMLAGRGLQPDRIAMLQNEGLVEPLGNSRLRVTPAGMIVLDAVVADLAR